jgi:hypothetical protein
MKKKVIFLCLIILSIVVICNGQTIKRKTEPCKFTWKRSAPSIFITYERKEDPKNMLNSNDETSSFIWLRFHNNTCWKLILEAGGGTKIKTRLFYDFLDENGSIIESISCHVCSLIWLSKGKSILFKVPIEYFRNSNKMRISFNYEWEDKPFSSPEKEPSHYVYFDIPDFLKK